MKLRIDMRCGLCGYPVLIAQKPYDHLFHCSNLFNCPEGGKFYEIPAFEVEVGRSFKKKPEPNGR